jgi:ABC-type branched-subunit amino acid transport system permease subunit
MLILALFAVAFNLLFSFTGLLSFGQAAFFAIGGYVCAKILLAVRPCCSESHLELSPPGWSR